MTVGPLLKSGTFDGKQNYRFKDYFLSREKMELLLVGRAVYLK